MQITYDSSNHEQGEPILEHKFVEEGVPHATFEQVCQLLREWHTVDPNGTWDPNGLTVTDAGLVYSDELGETVWSADGRGSFALTEWPWVIER